MKRSGKLLLIIGIVSLLFVLIPDPVYLTLNLGTNLIEFINNYLIIIAIFFISGGWGAMVAGKKRFREGENRYL